VLSLDATKLPFKSNTFDVLVTDLPFGKRIGSHKSNKKLYPSLFEEFSRVLKEKGRMVLLTSEKQLLLNSIKPLDSLKLKEHYSINQGGLDTFVFFITKEEKNSGGDNNERPTKKLKIELANT